MDNEKRESFLLRLFGLLVKEAVRRGHADNLEEAEQYIAKRFGRPGEERFEENMINATVRAAEHQIVLDRIFRLKEERGDVN